MLGGIFSQVIEALNRIGISSDAANASGTVHAKLAYLKNTIPISPVKNIQRGTASVSIPANGMTATLAVTISAVNRTKAFIDVKATGSLQYLNAARANFTNDTTLNIVAQHGSTNATTVDVEWQVIEYV